MTNAPYSDFSLVPRDATHDDILRLFPYERNGGGSSDARCGNKEGGTTNNDSAASAVEQSKEGTGSVLSNRKRRGPSQSFMFPTKLHKILSRPDLAHIVTWTTDGRAWKVLNKRLFAEKIMPEYFSQSKYPSFVRQVNGWGYRRATRGPHRNAYYHEMFLRGMYHLVKFMERLPVCQVLGDGCKYAEPDFGKYPPLPPLDTSEISVNAAAAVDPGRRYGMGSNSDGTAKKPQQWKNSGKISPVESGSTVPERKVHSGLAVASSLGGITSPSVPHNNSMASLQLKNPIQVAVFQNSLLTTIKSLNDASGTTNTADTMISLKPKYFPSSQHVARPQHSVDQQHQTHNRHFGEETRQHHQRFNMQGFHNSQGPHSRIVTASVAPNICPSSQDSKLNPLVHHYTTVSQCPHSEKLNMNQTRQEKSLGMMDCSTGQKLPSPVAAPNTMLDRSHSHQAEQSQAAPSPHGSTTCFRSKERGQAQPHAQLLHSHNRESVAPVPPPSVTSDQDGNYHIRTSSCGSNDSENQRIYEALERFCDSNNGGMDIDERSDAKPQHVEVTARVVADHREGDSRKGVDVKVMEVDYGRLSPTPLPFSAVL